MKTFRTLGTALVVVMLAFGMSACSDDDDEAMKELEKEYTRLIVGQWFDFTPQSSMYLVFEPGNSYYQVGYGVSNGWRDRKGTYRIEGNKLTREYTEDGEKVVKTEVIEVNADKFIQNRDDATGDRVNHRVRESFDITGKYTYLNSVVRVVAKAGKTEMKLPEGITFGGRSAISVEALKGERIVEQMKLFFADATFAEDGKLRHTVDGTVMYKDYSIEGNSLKFDLNQGHRLNTTSSPDEDGDRLFIIIPKQDAWIGGLVDTIRKENPANVLTDEVLAALSREFMDTFETFTVVLSLSKK